MESLFKFISFIINGIFSHNLFNSLNLEYLSIPILTFSSIKSFIKLISMKLSTTLILDKSIFFACSLLELLLLFVPFFSLLLRFIIFFSSITASGFFWAVSILFLYFLSCSIRIIFI